MPVSDTKITSDAQRIFLSYAREDKLKVTTIYRELSSHGFSPWLDIADLQPGQDWQEVIGNAIKNARFVLLFLSETSVAKRGYFQKEIAEALRVAETIPQGQKFIIPVRLEECFVPEKLRNWHWCDVFRPYGLRKLIETLSGSFGISSPPRRYPRKVRGRLSSDQLLDLLLAQKFWERQQCRIARLPNGEVAISNGAMLEWRSEVPRPFQELHRSVQTSPELTPYQVAYVTPAASQYRKPSNQVSTMRKGNSSYHVLLETASGTKCGVDPDYVTYILQKYPRANLYIADDKEHKIVVEESEKIRFLLMPMNI